MDHLLVLVAQRGMDGGGVKEEGASPGTDSPGYRPP